VIESALHIEPYFFTATPRSIYRHRRQDNDGTEQSSEWQLLLLLEVSAQHPVPIATIAVEQSTTSMSPSMVESDGVGCG